MVMVGMRDKKKKRKGKGFTLVELLVVIAIIGILAAIAIPNYMSYKTKGNDAVAKADVSNIRVAATAYFSNNASDLTSVASLADYGFVPSLNVAITLIDGTSKGFSVKAKHSSGSVEYTLYPNGTITP